MTTGLAGSSNTTLLTPAIAQAMIAKAINDYDTQIYAIAMPTSGTWAAGRFVVNSTPTVNTYTSGALTGWKWNVRGWRRLTTGSSNVPNVDWRTVIELMT